MCAITGRSSTGTIGLVISYVSGRSLSSEPRRQNHRSHRVILSSLLLRRQTLADQ